MLKSLSVAGCVALALCGAASAQGLFVGAGAGVSVGYGATAYSAPDAGYGYVQRGYQPRLPHGAVVFQPIQTAPTYYFQPTPGYGMESTVTYSRVTDGCAVQQRRVWSEKRQRYVVRPVERCY